MTTQAVSVSHDHGITRELYEVSRLYADVKARLRTVGTSEDVISEEFFRAALGLYAETMTDPVALAQMPPEARREALCGVATLALRWARKVRIG